MLGRSVCGFVALLALAPSSAGASAPRGKIVFLRCASCHNINNSSPAKIGPSLQGVFGRKAGSLPQYDYSPALRQANFNWDEAHLDHWLTKPTDLVPGTAMAFAGLPDEADRQAVIAYLRNPAP